MLRTLFTLCIIVAHINLSATSFRDALFASKPVERAKLSPSGAWIASTHFDDTTHHLCVSLTPSLDTSKNKRLVSQFSGLNLLSLEWSGNEDKILLSYVDQGSPLPKWHILDIATGQNLSIDHQDYVLEFIKMSSTSNQALMSRSNAQKGVKDVILLDLNDGHYKVVEEDISYTQLFADDLLNIALKEQLSEDGSLALFNSKNLRLCLFSPDIAIHQEIVHVDDSFCYFLDNRHSNFKQLYRLCFHDLKHHCVASAQGADIDDVLIVNHTPRAYATYGLKKEWHSLDEEMEDHLTVLRDKVGEGFQVINMSNEGDLWLLYTNYPTQGSRFWVYEATSKQTHLFYHNDLTHELYPMHTLSFHSRDGLPLTGYYSLPKEGKGPYPFIVIPHGGPYNVRDRFEYNPFHQWLCDCGYGVLTVNFRLSSGFGKAFVSAGDGEWGGKAHLDVVDGVDTLIERGLASRDQIAIFGMSYGGYEALSWLTFSPDRIACAAALSGPSNLKTVLDHLQPFWKLPRDRVGSRHVLFTKSYFEKCMGGSPNTCDGVQVLLNHSPLEYIHQIQAPLLLSHGKLDPIVHEGESAQIFEKLKSRGKDVTYLLLPDEGHGFAQRATLHGVLDKAEHFFSLHLGGKYVPFDRSKLSDAHILENDSLH